MEEIFFSFTFGGETLSLAASLATMNKLQNRPVVETLKKQGEKIITGLREIITENNAESFLSVAGHPSWSFFVIQDSKNVSSWALKTLFMQEMISRGVMTLGSHNLNFTHSDLDLSLTLEAYRQVIPYLVEGLNSDRLNELLRCKPLVPLFKLR